MPDINQPVSFPVDEWSDRDFTLVHTAILFADLENSVLISSTMSLQDYDRLLDQIHTALQQFIDYLHSEGFMVGEAQISGDQLSIFFYDAAEVEVNYQLDGPYPLEGNAREEKIAQQRERNQQLVTNAVRAAVILKNHWLTQPFNMARVEDQHQPLGLGIGLHCGKLYLRERPGGQRRIEGYAINLAKRVEGYARRGRFSHIMISEQVHRILSGAREGFTQLRQHYYFVQHEVQLELLKGILQDQSIFELKFTQGVSFGSALEAHELYDALFTIDPANIWAYYQLSHYYSTSPGCWDGLRDLAQMAVLQHPNEEKIMFDLALAYTQRKELGLALAYLERALEFNSEYDSAYDLKAEILGRLGRHEEQAQVLQRLVLLSPKSPLLLIKLAHAQLLVGENDSAWQNASNALGIVPDVAEHPEAQRLLSDLAQCFGKNLTD